MRSQSKRAQRCCTPRARDLQVEVPNNSLMVRVGMERRMHDKELLQRLRLESSRECDEPSEDFGMTNSAGEVFTLSLFILSRLIRRKLFALMKKGTLR
jgi:hypothetical protein